MFTRQEITAALNRWNDEVCNNPAAFKSTAQVIIETLRQHAFGQPVTYGDEAFATLAHYIDMNRNTASIIDAINGIGDAVATRLAKRKKAKAKPKARKRR